MCGRFGFAKPKEQIKKRFRLTNVPEQLPLLYNIAPQQSVPAVLNESSGDLSLVRWGLVPHWSKEEKFKLNLINARAETLLEKPLFLGPLKSKRCLILADCFYEWKTENGKKNPFRIFLKDEEPFAMAGIWDTWGEGEKQFNSCCIITTAPNTLVGGIHNRMPVILSKDDESKWLGQISLDEAMALLKTYPAQDMDAYPISTLVNSPLNNSPEIIKKI